MVQAPTGYSAHRSSQTRFCTVTRRRPNPVREVVRDLEEAFDFLRALLAEPVGQPSAPQKSPLRRIAAAFGVEGVERT